MYTIDAGLYWLLPGPRCFTHKIASRISTARVLVVNLPRTIVPGTRDGIIRGLHDAHIQDPVQLIIRSGTDIANDVGVHFGTRRMTAPQLADFRGSTEMAVILQAEDNKAQHMCEQYTREFVEAVGHCHGNVHLVTSIYDKRYQSDSQIDNVQLITFDGGLTPDEMNAYVTLRMVNRPGPGSTRLLRAIVSEFAGFDAQFAERLMRLDDGQILAVRDHLDLLLGEDPERWRTLDWLIGTTSIVSLMPHVLYDFYLSEYGTDPQKDEAKERISRRYWRACVKVITPWLEERRREVVGNFYPQLCQVAAMNPSGKIPIPMGKTFRYVDPAEIELNNIIGLNYYQHIHATSMDERKALKICWSAKPVRDDIAHLRAPSTSDLIRLIDEMDALVKL
jgi:hypothetical protein